MDADVEQITGRLRTTPPSCVRDFRLTKVEPSIESDENCKSSWLLACGCGEDRGRVLGYPLRDYAPDYEGEECFLSPLGFECSRCGKIIEIIDTDVHGYHNEVAKIEGGVGSVKLRGDGPRRNFPCSSCGAQEFAVTVSFVYSDAAYDLFLDEPDLLFEEFFDIFHSSGRCMRCGETSALTDFGKL